MDPAGDHHLKPLVGEPTYDVWLHLLQGLQPSHTHRLAALVAGMLQYAAIAAGRTYGRQPPAGSLAESLLTADAWSDPERVMAELKGPVEQLFTDAGVAHTRRNKRGTAYSLAEAAIDEYVHWNNWPGEEGWGFVRR